MATQPQLQPSPAPVNGTGPSPALTEAAIQAQAPLSQPTVAKTQKAVKPSSGLILPTQKSKPKDRMSDYKWMIYGPPGIGKTSFANQFDMPLILDFEGRTKHLECYSIPIGEMEDVRKVHQLLKTTDHKFKTVVFDTADLFWRLAVADVCAKRKIEHPSDEAYGKGSDMVKNTIYPTITAFQALGLCIVFTSHVQEKEIKTRSLTYTKTTPSLAGSPAGIFLSLCDVVGYMHFDEETQQDRVMSFRGSDYLDAKKSTNEIVQLPDRVTVPSDGQSGEAASKALFEKVKSYFGGESNVL